MRRRSSGAITPFGLLAGAAVLTGAVALFAEVADDQSEDDGRRFDQEVLNAVRRPGLPNAPVGPAWLTPIARACSALGSVPFLGGVTAIASAYFVARGQKRAALNVVGAFVGGLAISEGLKAIYDRGRPAREYRLISSDEEGFPSGHAMLSATVYMLFAAFAATALKSTRAKLAAIGTAMAASCATGVSRVYLGVHWANDVLAGWSAGAAWSALWWIAHRPKQRALAETPLRFRTFAR